MIHVKGYHGFFRPSLYYVYFNIEDIKNGLFRIQYHDYDANKHSAVKGYYDTYIEAVQRALVKNETY